MRSQIAPVDTSLLQSFATAQGTKQLTASDSNSRDNSNNRFQGNSGRGGQDKSKRKGGNPLEDGNCICGFYHPTSQCFLINPDKRPAGYVAWQVKLDKVNEDADRLDQSTRIEAEIGHPIPRQGIQKSTTAATASNVPTITPTGPILQPQNIGFEVTGSWAVSNPVWNLPPDYRHMIPSPMPMSASESALPPLISLQASYVPGPMVYRDWTIFDSGTQRHIMNSPESFVDLQPFKSQHCVLHGDTYTPVLGQGTTRIIATSPEGETCCVMHNVLFIPGFLANLVSMDIVKSKGYIWDHEIDWVVCCRTRKPMWKIHREHGQNFISRKKPIPAPSIPVTLQAALIRTGDNEKEQPEIGHGVQPALSSNSSNAVSSRSTIVSSAPADLWHARLGHPGYAVTEHLQSNVANAIVEGKRNPNVYCQTCITANMPEQVSRRPMPMGSTSWERVHYDIIDLGSKIAYYKNCRYILHFYCGCSHAHIVNPVSSKDQLTQLSHIKSAKGLIKNQGYRIKYFHVDGERGLGAETDLWLRRKSITKEDTVAYTPSQNGPAERSGTLLLKVARAMRVYAGLPEALLPILIKTAAYLLMRTPIRSRNWITPAEFLEDRKPDISNLFVVGCRAYVKYPMKKLKAMGVAKHHDRIWIGYLVGFKASNIWIIWNPRRPINHSLAYARDVIFDESILYKDDPDARPEPVPEEIVQECSIVPMQLLSDTEIDIYHAPSHLRYDAPPLDNTRDSPHGSQDTLTNVHHTLPQLITPPDSQASTRDPTPHIEDVPSSNRYHISTPPRTDAKPKAELNSRREMTQGVRQNAGNDRRSTTDVRVIHPRLVRDHSVCQRRAQASQAKDDHQPT